MLSITIPATETYDHKTNTFTNTKQQRLQLEHSLISISKWESKWEKPFLGKDNKTYEETIDYIRCMTLTQNVDEDIYHSITNSIMDEISTYIDAQMSATWINDLDEPTNKKEVITSELIYYWMVALSIPFECQKWHLNRLLTLVRVCNIKNASEKKMPRKELVNRNRSLNAKRRAELNTKG